MYGLPLINKVRATGSSDLVDLKSITLSPLIAAMPEIQTEVDGPVIQVLPIAVYS